MRNLCGQKNSQHHLGDPSEFSTEPRLMPGRGHGSCIEDSSFPTGSQDHESQRIWTKPKSWNRRRVGATRCLDLNSAQESAFCVRSS